MTPNEYQVLAQRTSSTNTPGDKLLNGALGLNGEAGEVADIIKKFRYQGHPLDTDHVMEELGDVAWYLAEACAGLNVDLETVLSANIAKLEKRYPNLRFEAERSINRVI